MTPAELHAASLWRRLAEVWGGYIADMILFHGQASEWWSARFGKAVYDVLTFSDITTAANIRYRALKQKTQWPRWTDPTLPVLADANGWVRSHIAKTQPLIRWQVAQTVKVEKQYLAGKAMAIEHAVRGIPVADKKLLPSRLRRFKRDSVGEIHAVSEQVQLSDPKIGDAFPMSSYHSREDARVRPTHAEMNGLVAVRTWEGWPYCRPLAGWNCRCTTRHWSRSECIQHGWMDKAGRPLFEVRWPSVKAKANYLRGVPFHGNANPKAFPSAMRNMIFPDAGPWMLPRFTAAQGIPKTAVAA